MRNFFISSYSRSREAQVKKEKIKRRRREEERKNQVRCEGVHPLITNYSLSLSLTTLYHPSAAIPEIPPLSLFLSTRKVHHHPIPSHQKQKKRRTTLEFPIRRSSSWKNNHNNHNHIIFFFPQVVQHISLSLEDLILADIPKSHHHSKSTDFCNKKVFRHSVIHFCYCRFPLFYQPLNHSSPTTWFIIIHPSQSCSNTGKKGEERRTVSGKYW